MRYLGENPAIIQPEEQQELNFENENSKENRELAHQDLEAAKALSKKSKDTDSTNKSLKKALNRKAKQTSMESVEHAQKAVTFADDKYKKIKNRNLHKNLEKTHNNDFAQREHEAAGIAILEKSDIAKLNSAVKKPKGEKSPYNAVRFYDQEIDDKSVDEAIEVAEKAIDNLEKKVHEGKGTTIHIDGMEYQIGFESR